MIASLSRKYIIRNLVLLRDFFELKFVFHSRLIFFLLWGAALGLTFGLTQK